MLDLPVSAASICLPETTWDGKVLKPGRDHKLWRLHSTIAVICRKVWLFWSSSAVRGRMVDNELKKSDSNQAAGRLCCQRCSKVCPGSCEGGLFEIFCTSPLHSFLINHFRPGQPQARTCSGLDSNNINVEGCIVLSDVLARLTPLTSLWLNLRLWGCLARLVASRLSPCDQGVTDSVRSGRLRCPRLFPVLT